jgi:hypothetical protein
VDDQQHYSLARHMLREVTELSENREVRRLCSQSIEQWIFALRAMLDASELPADRRRGIEAQLRLFRDA